MSAKSEPVPQDSLTIKAIVVEEVDAVILRGHKEPIYITLRTSTAEEELYARSHHLFHDESPYKIEAENVGEPKGILIDRANCLRLLVRLATDGGQLVFYYNKDVDK